MTEVLTYFYSDPGGREVNEDSVSILKRPGITGAVVADGLGGHGGGDQASSMVVHGLTQYLEENETIDQASLDRVLSEVNEAIYDAQTGDCQMKSTLAGVLVDEKDLSALLFHVGDSRIYHLIDGKVASISVDHSVSRMAVFAGEITHDEIRHHPDRSKLLRAMGGDDEVTVEYEKIEELSSEASHAFLLCSDGFWEYVLESEMEETLKGSDTPETWINKMRKILAERVKDVRNDNNTAAAIWLRNH